MHQQVDLEQIAQHYQELQFFGVMQLVPHQQQQDITQKAQIGDTGTTPA